MYDVYYQKTPEEQRNVINVIVKDCLTITTWTFPGGVIAHVQKALSDRPSCPLALYSHTCNLRCRFIPVNRPES